ncbi:AAA family ATPase [Curvibacter lanceolatus]|uniref:AAA family ATPase n=1 Tax=Curvibacter lanceolatus TaxID=86182 RepID=UPI00035D9545|nr:AAA family ATPase [Curvibacter lanceolatus]
MKLTHLTIENFLGARAVDLDLAAEPVHLFCGLNGAGKSSIQEAVRVALTGEAVRVALKKEYGRLLTEGAEGGFIEVQADGESSVVTLPSGKGSGPVERPAALPYVLAAQRFARMDANERRAFLFGLMGLTADGPAVREKLAARGADAARIQAIGPLLRAGFDAAAEEAKNRARDAKAAWRAVTGETYGAKKAEGWKAAQPAEAGADTQALQAELDELDAKLASHNRELGALQAAEQARVNARSQVEALREKAGKHARIAEKLKRDQAELADWEAAVAAATAMAGNGPRVGLLHDAIAALDEVVVFAPDDKTVNAEAVLKAYEREYGPVGSSGDPKAAEALPEYVKARDLMARAVENGKRDLAEADAAANQLAAISLDKSDDDSTKLDMLRDLVVELQTQQRDLRAKIQAAKAAESARAQADEKTAKAAQHHADVAGWDLIAEQLAPGGIPGELLVEALGPLNARLASSAREAEWLKAEVHADMPITGGGRRYELLSESEQWRVDAMLAEAVSHLSGLRLLVLDRFDVLDLRGRGDLLAWLDGLTEDGSIETALLFGTLKAAPAAGTGLAVHWVERGVVGGLKVAA